ncbi:MAG TPA: helix-turn-helix transcriptional regulator [Rhizobiaceae bacterium]|nr:helix-turn-helix transcriptional regulator [Rhizobiaceae bacterium]
MPRKTIPRLLSVSATAKPFSVHTRWDTGDDGEIDLTGPIMTFSLYRPLRDSPQAFAQVRLGDLRTDIVWSEEIDMSADTLWRLRQEQSGVTMSADAFRSWRERNAHTLDTAARALGLSRRMIAYYEQGEKPIPRTVALATKALDMIGQAAPAR